MSKELEKENINFLHKGVVINRLIVLFIILFIQGAFLYKYYAEQDFWDNFKLSYIQKIYFPTWRYTVEIEDGEGGAGLLAMVTGLLAPETCCVATEVATATAKSVPALLYHGVVDSPDGDGILIENFREQMFALKREGWQTVSIADFYAFTRGDKELPDKSFLLTFDDGRKDSYYPVDPILRALDYQAVMYLITKYSLDEGYDGRYYLTKKEVEEMQASGRWEIEAHTEAGHGFYPVDADGKQGHFYSNKLWLEERNRLEKEGEFKVRVLNDFVEARAEIERALEKEVISLAYPFGDYGEATVNFPEAEKIVPGLAEAVYKLTFYQVWPGKGFSFNYPEPEEFLKKRIDVKNDWTAGNLLVALAAAREKNLPYEDDLRNDRGWVGVWGEIFLNGGGLVLGARAENTGSSTFLDGTYTWKDYDFRAEIDWRQGSHVSLLARYKDEINYAACTFSDQEARIEQRLNNKERVIVKVSDDETRAGKRIELGMRVKGDRVECLTEGKVTAYAYYLSPVLKQGGVGFKTWDPAVGKSRVIINKVKIEEI